ncbi:MAG TPA: 2'-5' RNA ligase family protein [Pyrinomonadaceae bacterium]|jgi:2'-5' RNA ligase
MQGIVSLLDDEHYALVESIWAELDREFGVHGIYTTPFPHFSYQVAQSYDTEAVEPILQQVASRITPFKIKTAGLGIFNVTHPVLYIPVVRSPVLSALHETLWNEITTFAAGAPEYYRPDMWMPHITLAHGDVDWDKLTELVRSLRERQFHWELTVNNLSVIYDTGTEQGLQCRFNFNGGNGKSEV